MGTRQSNQFGGVAAFIVIGVVLAALLGGGIYLSKQWGRNARLAADGLTTGQQEDQPASNTDEQNGDNSTPEEDQPPTSDTTDENQDSQPAPSQDQSDNTSGSGDSESDTPVPATGPTHIASTGPEDILAPIFGLSFSVAGIVAYRRSRSQLVRSALK